MVFANVQGRVFLLLLLVLLTHTPQAFEELYPELRALKLQGKPVGAAFGNVSTANLALQLNCLTVPGAAIKSHDLTPGRLLRTAGFGALKVISSRWGSSQQKPGHLLYRRGLKGRAID